MAEGSGEKKHEATEYRRQRAREEGNVAKSTDLTSAVLLLVGVILLDSTGPTLGDALRQLVEDGIGSRVDLHSDSRTEVLQLTRYVLQSGLALLPLMGGMLLTSLIVHFAQVGPLWL
ncbi:MAG: EscU/YscU/HrcU family type III secretion system export apparatus switch protein, partial [bacterium]